MTPTRQGGQRRTGFKTLWIPDSYKTELHCWVERRVYFISTEEHIQYKIQLHSHFPLLHHSRETQPSLVHHRALGSTLARVNPVSSPRYSPRRHTSFIYTLHHHNHHIDLTSNHT